MIERLLRKVCGAIVSRTPSLWPDKIYLQILHWTVLGKKLHLDHPRLFSEKLQWIKLYDRRPLYTTLVDKIEVKQWVAERIGEEYIIPTLGVWDDPDEIDFDKMPNQFVLKCNHDSGGLSICKDKSSFDIAAAKEKLAKSLKRNYYLSGREWPYKNVKRRILAEAFLEDTAVKDLRDYKFFCFNGKPEFMYVASDRFKKDETLKYDFYDMQYTRLDITESNHDMSEHGIPKPVSFEEMKQLAEVLSKGLPEVRVDFYDVGGKIYFGEMTLFHDCGFLSFHPDKWNFVFGDLIQLPSKVEQN